MNWRIVADSSCDLPESLFKSKAASFSNIPLSFMIGGKEYIDNEDLNVNEMLDAMSNCKESSSSACPSPDAFAAAYKEADNVIVFTISHNLSGCYNSAVLAKDMVLEQHPEKNIHVIDTLATAGSMVLCIQKANELIEAGKSFEEVTTALDTYVKNIYLLFTLSSYENLVKAGRVSKFSGYLATQLGIRTLAGASPEGTIQILQKIRGEKKVYKAIVEKMTEKVNLSERTVYIHHCNNLEGATKIKELLLELCPSCEIHILPTRGLTSYYAERGGLIISY
mgnify:CR=1 FL=1|nr:DegV family protein [uncultured Cellulosilyticum sp.]